MYFKTKAEQIGFLKGLGLGKIVKHTNRLKKYLKFNKNKNVNFYLRSLKLELYQIRKHQKLTMRYLYQLEVYLSKNNLNK